eukprot:Blabericola_migrator_1__7480@NODE_381_length_9180_cov_88_545814_g304_i0_p2_GENE_NODE_381_length_9180_cov_88_545814_g304_i0NODE_381_length_9180_cov_88_545814_g304_i0_p2_ORF_typecomplete_len872_score138_88Adaptin_N/PF01602_20/1_9e76Cnd1/PF12717_7/0_34Cnd1/PF12717_7/0_69Cnd1/PF12717_7/2_9e02Proteasom_PSMB/PF10508_9/16Proteasom_PSMB/PF10508_9/0_16Vac14_Fab1_bd/PF12755_7/0_22Gag_p12/PF01141_18/1_9_NODE_381_length_9180_cov_88_545814_g304_i065639148
MSTKLRDFISAVRQCKSSSEEAALVAKESAAIRTAFKDEASPYRHRNVAKLLLISMLGYQVHFGQIECIKLIASNHFLEKRLGYIAMGILLDQSSDVLMLATNTIRNDLSSGNQYIISAALTALGNVGTTEMVETVSREIDDFISGTNPSLKKRSIALAIKMVNNNPDAGAKYISKIPGLLTDYNHSITQGATALVETLLRTNAIEHGPKIIECVPTLCNYIQEMIAGSPSLVGSVKALAAHQAGGGVSRPYGYRGGAAASLEYEFNGVNDPFLQSRIVRVLRVLIEVCGGQMVDSDALVKIIDVAKYLLLPAENYRNGGLSIVYEAVKLAFALCHLMKIHGGGLSTSSSGDTTASQTLSSDSTFGVKDNCLYLQRLALDWLDHFVAQKDTTVKYVGLSVLIEIASVFPELVKKYATTVQEALSQGDTSIQMKAVTLLAMLTDRERAVETTSELLNFLLVVTDPLPVRAPSTLPLGKDVSFAEGTTIVVSNTNAPAHSAQVAESQSKAALVKLVIEKVEYVMENFAVSRSWQLDSMIRLCCLAGNVISNHTKQKIAMSLVEAPELRKQALERLAVTLQENVFQVALAEIAIWCFGEFLGHHDSVSLTSATAPKIPDPVPSGKGMSILDDLLDDPTPKASDSPPTEAVKVTDVMEADSLLSGADTPSPVDGPLNPRRAMDLILHVGRLYGLLPSDQASQFPHIKPQRALTLIQNSRAAGICGPVDGSQDCLKKTPDPSTHITKAGHFEMHPQATMPPQARKALRDSSLPSLIVMAAAKLVAVDPSLRRDVLAMYDNLEESCVEFEITLRLEELRVLLSAEVFEKSGLAILRSRPEMTAKITSPAITASSKTLESQSSLISVL